MVTTIDRLAAAGMVERVPSPVDRRVKLVVVSAQGRALAGRVRHASSELRRQLLGRIDGERLAVAAEVLEQLLRILEEPR
jgi:MarR family transcriptional regulator for hemolysin